MRKLREGRTGAEIGLVGKKIGGFAPGAGSRELVDVIM